MTDPASPALALKQRFYPESRLSGFSYRDGKLGFYMQIAALLRPEHAVLEFGAGRGANIASASVPYIGELQRFQGRCARYAGCDVDPAVLENPHLDDAQVIAPDRPLPYVDGTFDMVVASWVFEHVDNPGFVAHELLRVTRPGGWICALTPNKWGYIGLFSRIIGNGLHARVLGRVQPGRQSRDVFPTRYRLNTVRALREAFGHGGEVVIARTSAEPSYHFNRSMVYRLFRLVHALCPPMLETTLHVYVRKHGG